MLAKIDPFVVKRGYMRTSKEVTMRRGFRSQMPS